MGLGDWWSKLVHPESREGPRPGTGPLLLILLAVGVALLLFNSLFNRGGKAEQEPPPRETVPETGSLSAEDQLCRSLVRILTQVRGVSEVEIFLTLEAGGRLEPVADEEQSRRQTSEGDSGGGNREIVEETVRRTHVLLRDPQGNERPLVAEEGRPRYRGVLVVAAGVDDPEVEDAVTRALQSLLGLPAHRITVLPR